MPVKRVRYKGMLIRAAAFEVMGTGCFIEALLIRRAGPADRGHAKLFEVPPADTLTDDPDEALHRALAYGRAIVDGDIPGESVEDL